MIPGKAHLQHREKQHLSNQVSWLAPTRSDIADTEQLVHEHCPLANLFPRQPTARWGSPGQRAFTMCFVSRELLPPYIEETGAHLEYLLLYIRSKT